MTRAAAIARAVILQAAGKVLGLPLSLVTLAIATRYLGADGYGVLAAAVAFVGLFESFSELGMGTVIVRRVTGARQESLSRLVGMNLTLSGAYAIPLAALSCAVGLIAYAGRPQLQLAVAVVSAGLIFTTLATCFDPIFDVHVRYTAVASAEFASRLVTLGLAALVMFTDSGLLAMCAVQVVPQLVRLIVTGFAARSYLKLRLVFASRETRKLLVEALPFTMMLLISVIYWKVDSVLLSLLSTDREVGAYGLAFNIAFNLSMLQQIFSRSALSTITKGFADDRKRFFAAVDSGYRFLLLCAAPIAVIGYPLAGRIVTAIGSADFTALATPALRLLFIACAAQFLTSIVSNALIAAYEQRYLTTLSAVNLVVNIVMNVVLIPVLGATGSAIAMVITEVSGVVFTQPRLRKIGVAYPPLGYFLRLVPGLGLALLAIWATWSLPLVVPLAAGGVAYLIGALAAGAIPARMRAVLLAALRPGASAPS